MTDSSFAADNAAAPVIDTSGSGPAPVIEAPAGEFSGRTDDNFEQNLSAFLANGFDDGEFNSPQIQVPEPAPVAAPVPAAATPAPTPAPAAAAPISPTAPANGVGAPAPAPATAEQPGTAPSGASPQVDPNLLMAMVTGQPAAQPAPAPVAAAPAATPAPEAPAAEALWEPFASNFQLPPQLTEALFRSEDPQQQGAALVGLLSSFGNAMAQLVDQRVATHHAPAIAQRASAGFQEQQQAAAVNQHFYGSNPDLAPYKDVTKRAGEVYFQRNPTATWSTETAQAIAELSRATLRHMGVPVGPAQAPAPAAPAAPVATVAAPTPYVAGGARPAAFAEPMSQDDPGALFDQLSMF